MTTTYATVRELPAPIRAALAEVKYHGKDIGVTVADATTMSSPAFASYTQGFTVLVNLTSGQFEVMRGEFGGGFWAYDQSAVDADERLYALPPNSAVIKGQYGGGPVSADLILPSAQAPKVLASGVEDTGLTPVQRRVLGIYDHYTPASRPEYIRAAGGTKADLEVLVDGGYLKRNKAGATSLTTAGRNAMSRPY